MNPEKHDLIIKEIDDLIKSKKSISAKKRAVLKYIRDLGHLPVVINHQQYKTKKLIFFIHEGMLFGVKIFNVYDTDEVENISYCSYIPMNELNNLDINLKKDQIKFNELLRPFYKQKCYLYHYFNFCLDITYGQASFYKNLYDSMNNKFHLHVFKNYHRSTQFLHIFFEK